MEREFLKQEFENNGAQDQRRKEETARAIALESQLVRRMNRIAELWGGLVAEYNSKHAFNIHTAKELSKAFHDLEDSGFWPKPNREK